MFLNAAAINTEQHLSTIKKYAFLIKLINFRQENTEHCAPSTFLSETAYTSRYTVIFLIGK